MAASEATAARISGGAAGVFPRRRLLHRAVAEAIETLYADRLDAPVAALAGHFWETADLSRSPSQAA